MTTLSFVYMKKLKELLLLQTKKMGLVLCSATNVDYVLTMTVKKQRFCSSATVSGGTANSGSSAPSATGGGRANSIAKELFRKKKKR